MSDEKLKQILASYLHDRLNSDIVIWQFYLLTGGACQKNYLIDLEVKQGSNKGSYESVFRTSGDGDKLSNSLERHDEFLTAQLAHERGVNTPKVYWLERDTKYTGSPFYFMDRIKGNANGRYLVKDKSLGEIRSQLPDLLAENLVRIHAVKYGDPIEESLKKTLLCFGEANTSNYVLKLIESIRSELEEREEEAYPGLEILLNWLEKNVPETKELVLVHGDYRAGNFMVSPDGFHGVLDWEFAHWGNRHEDIGWISLLDWRFGKRQQEAGGITSLDNFIERYNHYSDTSVDIDKVLYWQVFGNVRWGFACIQQTERYLSGAEKSIDLLAIGRRTFEMQYEAFRLVEQNY